MHCEHDGRCDCRSGVPHEFEEQSRIAVPKGDVIGTRAECVAFGHALVMRRTAGSILSEPGDDCEKVRQGLAATHIDIERGNYLFDGITCDFASLCPSVS